MVDSWLIQSYNIAKKSSLSEGRRVQQLKIVYQLRLGSKKKHSSLYERAPVHRRLAVLTLQAMECRGQGKLGTVYTGVKYSMYCIKIKVHCSQDI